MARIIAGLSGPSSNLIAAPLEWILDWFHIGKRFQNVKMPRAGLETVIAPNGNWRGGTQEVLINWPNFITTCEATIPRLQGCKDPP